ncbi:MAG: aminoacyl-tRNA hydrolase [Deltaproteobacteria bacterium]|nr:aminoacyl-tRNA hydrolase [Deltaproteobacteria bacterium]
MGTKDIYVGVGLGNPGGRYEGTRHNIGFAAVDMLAAVYRLDVGHNNFGSLLGRGRIEGIDTFLVKPQSYMNLSGGPVRRVLDYFKLSLDHLIVLHDDLDLQVGRIKVAARGGAGGHKGVASIIETLGDQRFARIKIGIGRPPEKNATVDYVLGGFFSDEKSSLQEAMENAVKATQVFITAGVIQAQNLFNRKES